MRLHLGIVFYDINYIRKFDKVCISTTSIIPGHATCYTREQLLKEAQTSNPYLKFIFSRALAQFPTKEECHDQAK